MEARGFCLDGLNGALAGTAQGGEKAGALRTDLCIALVTCMRRTNCAHQMPSTPSAGWFTAVTDCFCGANADPNVCFTASSPDALTGACKREYMAAAETNVVSEVSNRATDPTLAVGAATALAESCDDFLCRLECNACKPSAGDAGDCVPSMFTAGAGGTSSAGTGGAGAGGMGMTGAGAGGGGAGRAGGGGNG
jgi:hypothetical protein